jgi:hypothetical protein
VETFTIREAAGACGLTYEALRARVDRGTIRAGKRREDGARVIPKSELQRVGLLPGDAQTDLQAEVLRLRAELKTHRVLTEKAQVETTAERKARERMEEAFHRARAEKQAADQAAQELRTQLEEIAAAGPIRALRLRRKLRAERAG